MISNSPGRSGFTRVGGAGARFRYRFGDYASGVPCERLPAGGHFVQHGAEAEKIGARVEIVAAHLLGRHVSNRSYRSSRARQQHFGGDGRHRGRACAHSHAFGSEFGEAEVEHLRLSALRHKNIGGLDVAMDDAFRVGGFERVGDLNSQVEHLIEGEWLFGDPVFQRLPFKQLHRDERDQFAAIVHHINFVNRADIRMVQRRGCACFALKSLKRRAILRKSFRQELQGHLAAELGVLGLVHDAHAAAAELFQYQIVRECFSDHRVTKGGRDVRLHPATCQAAARSAASHRGRRM